MSDISVTIQTDEYFIKKAKPISNASQIYLNKKFIGKYMNLIPLYAFDKDNIITFDNYYEITLNVNCIFRKEARKRGRGAYCYLPLEFSGQNILIFKAPF